MHSVLPTVKSGTRLLCSEHTIPLKQHYRCPGDDKIKAHDDVTIVRGVESTDGWTVLTEDKPTVEDTKVVDKKALNLVPIPATEVDKNTVVGEAIYYVAPSGPASNQVWSILSGIIKKGKVALITKAAFTPNEKMYRLDTFRGYLVLRELVYPEKISEAPPMPEVRVDKAMLGLVDEFVDNLLISWDGFDTTDTNQRRFDAWIATGKHIADEDVQVKLVDPGVSLMDSLKKSIEESKKKK